MTHIQHPQLHKLVFEVDVLPPQPGILDRQQFCFIFLFWLLPLVFVLLFVGVGILEVGLLDDFGEDLVDLTFFGFVGIFTTLIELLVDPFHVLLPGMIVVEFEYFLVIFGEVVGMGEFFPEGLIFLLKNFEVFGDFDEELFVMGPAGIFLHFGIAL